MINLLPPKEKEVLRIERNFKVILILEILIFLFLCIFTLILFFIKIHLGEAVEVEKILFEAKNKEFLQIKTLEEKLNLINKEVSNLNSFYKTQVDLTDLLERITHLLPPGVYLNSFSYQKDAKKIELSGFSPKIDLLLDFKHNLEKQEDFQKIIFSPHSVWIERENINFTVSIEIN